MTNNITQEQLDDAVLSITSRPEWSVIVKGLQNDIYHSQANALDASSWEAVCRLRGFAEGLVFVINLRETVKSAQSIEAKNDAQI